jgi:phage replication O-like protein O
MSKYMPKRGEWLQFNGFLNPTTTPVPDEVFDNLMADLTGAEIKVLLYICRRTFGFKKERDNISLSQLTQGIVKKGGQVLDRGTGLAKDSVIRALKGLEEKNIVIKTKRNSKKKGHEATTYSLNFISLSENKTRDGGKIGQGLVRKSDTQQTVIQQTVNNTVNGVVKGGEESWIRKIKNLNQSNEKTQYIADYILEQLKDEHSRRFYKLVASKVPESVIRTALSEIKADGAKHPSKVFVHRMKEYVMRDSRRGLVKSF